MCNITLNIGCCFAKPYHSWERGAKENLNYIYLQTIKDNISKGCTYDLNTTHLLLVI